jgi:hypothetical protein
LKVQLFFSNFFCIPSLVLASSPNSNLYPNKIPLSTAQRFGRLRYQIYEPYLFH